MTSKNWRRAMTVLVNRMGREQGYGFTHPMNENGVIGNTEHALASKNHQNHTVRMYIDGIVLCVEVDGQSIRTFDIFDDFINSNHLYHTISHLIRVIRKAVYNGDYDVVEEQDELTPCEDSATCEECTDHDECLSQSTTLVSDMNNRVPHTYGMYPKPIQMPEMSLKDQLTTLANRIQERVNRHPSWSLRDNDTVISFPRVYITLEMGWICVAHDTGYTFDTHDVETVIEWMNRMYDSHDDIMPKPRIGILNMATAEDIPTTCIDGVRYYTLGVRTYHEVTDYRIQVSVGGHIQAVIDTEYGGEYGVKTLTKGYARWNDRHFGTLREAIKFCDKEVK